jgi:hypothetical protein
MLRPGFLDNDWKTNLVPLSQFRYTQDFWQVVNRDTPGGLFTSVKPAPKTFLLIELIIQIAIIAILINATAQDDMKWALESKFTLGADEGFAVHYHGLVVRPIGGLREAQGVYYPCSNFSQNSRRIPLQLDKR